MNATSLVVIIGRQNVRQSFEIFNAASFDYVLIQAVFVVPNKTVYLNFDNNDKKQNQLQFCHLEAEGDWISLVNSLAT